MDAKTTLSDYEHDCQLREVFAATDLINERAEATLAERKVLHLEKLILWLWGFARLRLPRLHKNCTCPYCQNLDALESIVGPIPHTERTGTVINVFASPGDLDRD